VQAASAAWARTQAYDEGVDGVVVVGKGGACVFRHTVREVWQHRQRGKLVRDVGAVACEASAVGWRGAVATVGSAVQDGHHLGTAVDRLRIAHASVDARSIKHKTLCEHLSIEHPDVDHQLAYDERDKDHEHLPPLQAIERLVCGHHRQQRRKTRERKRTAREASRRTSDKKVRNVSFCGAQHGSA
jgi:hypothetical protein